MIFQGEQRKSLHGCHMLVFCKGSEFEFSSLQVCQVSVKSTNTFYVQYFIDVLMENSHREFYFALQNHCRSWNNCSANVERDGCTFYDVMAQVLNYQSWSQFAVYYATQRYGNVIDAVRHLCSKVKPGTDTRHSVIEDTLSLPL